MTVVLETERVFLRELLLNDVEPLTAILGSPDVTKHIGGPREQAAVRRWIQEQHESYRDNGYGYWAVIHRDSATLVGQAGLHGKPPELGCVLDQPYWRHGLGKEVLTAIRDFALGSLELPSLTASIHQEHEAGKKLAASLGMKVEPRGDDIVCVIERPGQ